MNDTAHLVYTQLEAMGIEYTSISHPPVHTIADCAATDAALDSLTVKNYFLTTKNRKNFYLCIVRPEARFRTSDISRQVGSSRLSFGNEEQLAEHLHTYPGAVSPMGLLFDAQKQVRLIADRVLLDVGKLAFHPCDNTQTLSVTSADFFERFLPAVGREPIFVDIHDFLENDQ